MADDFGASRTLLDRPYRRRFFVSKNGGGRNAQQQVASVVEHTTRYGFFKITVSRGIVIDPRHPEEATVFALLVKPGDLDRLRDQLKVALPDLIEERTADPAIITQLADIGQVQSLSPAPLADVSISREALALRVRTGDGADSGPQQSSAAVQQALPTAEQFRSCSFAGPGSIRRHRRARARDGPGGSRRLFPRVRIAVGRREAVSRADFRHASRALAVR